MTGICVRLKCTVVEHYKVHHTVEPRCTGLHFDVKRANAVVL